MKQRIKLIVGVFLFVRRGRKILLARRQNTGFADGLLHVPSGHLDGGENIINAMIREANEELGIKVQPKDLQLVHIMHERMVDERIHIFFELRKWSGKLFNAEPHKCKELIWVDISKLPKDMVLYTRTAINAYNKGKLYSLYGI